MKPVWLLLLLVVPTIAGEASSLIADRTAIERVYYNHRLGQKPPFEQTLTSAMLEDMVRLNFRKETVLKQTYGVEITSDMINAEVQRIKTTTRAPEVLAEIKAALGNDPGRFAASVAKPLLVERLLRERFENDDALHAPQRKACETTRASLLAGQTHLAGMTETTWQLGPRPAETETPGVDEMEIKKRFGPDAQLLSPPQAAGRDHKLYFEDLPPALQNVLRAQLRAPGSISAVIETPTGFLLYLAREKTEEVLSVACLSVPKQSYEDWLNQQTELPR